MLRLIKKWWLVVALLLAGGQSMYGFALLGPFNESYQTPAIGYDLTAGVDEGFGNQNGSVDVGAPKNIGQGYRYNIPTLYYAYDFTFATFFGSNGIAQSDQAFAIFNSLSNASSYTNLNLLPLDTRRQNPTAEALSLIDVKSSMMSAIIEQMGLASPDRWTWALRGRFIPAGAVCPAFEYLIIMRNYDPITQTYSSFVNGTFYGYAIAELCGLNPNPFAPLEADAIEVTVDPTTANSAVASAAIGEGLFYTGLTRDDIGGLKYLYAATNVIPESLPADTLLEFSNAPVQLTTSNLALFEEQILTNSPAQLQLLYPDLIIDTNDLVQTLETSVTTNSIFFLTNSPTGSAGTATLVQANVLTTNVITVFSGYQFPNLVTNFTFTLFGHTNIIQTNFVYTNGFVTTQLVEQIPVPTGVVGTVEIVTNDVPNPPQLANFLNGEFIIIPAADCGGFTNLILLETRVTPVTNNLVTFVPGTLNNNTILAASQITFYTNHVFSAVPITCTSNDLALEQGIEKVTFVRRDFDSIIGSAFAWPGITNDFTKTSVTNGAAVVRKFHRVVTTPDILISAADETVVTGANASLNPFVRTAPNFNTNLVAGNEGGPGTINPKVTFTFNNVGPLFFNPGPHFGGSFSILTVDQSGSTNVSTQVAQVAVQATSVLEFQWGSYDGTTNVPIVYPTNSSIAALEQQIFFQITNSSLLTYSVSKPFSVQLGATGGSPPYTFPTNGLALPRNLNINASSGILSGTISGATATNIPEEFFVQAMDSGGRITQAQMTIIFGP